MADPSNATSDNRPNPGSGRILELGFLLVAALVGVLNSTQSPLANWLQILFLFLALSLLYSGARHGLPMQTCLGAYGFIYLGSWLAPVLGLLPAIPGAGFHRGFLQLAGLQQWEVWTHPALVGVVLLSARGLIRYWWSNLGNGSAIGFPALGLGVGLSIGWFMAFRGGNGITHPHSFLGSSHVVWAVLWTGCIALLLAVASVLLVPKKPGFPIRRPQAAIVWLGLNLMLAIPALKAESRWPLSFALVQIAFTTALLWRHRRPNRPG